jgi:hypothetical protein
MNDTDKEHVLHKVVAASAFVFALMILPVAQYILVGSKPAETGQVAGVSTDASVTKQSVLSPAECVAQQQKDLADLTTFEAGKKQALLRAYETAVAPYKAAQQVLTGTPEKIQTEKQALNSLIDVEYQPYLAKLSTVQTAVEKQRADITARTCN